MTIHYPFSALIGQEEMQLALLLNAVNPAIGGVLIRGEKGTAKSTAARGLAALLPPNAQTELTITLQTQDGENRAAVPTATTPFIELPVGVSDDRLVGTLDIEAALTQGKRHFEPGLLARAHGGVLYVDEVNLLPDHIVDLLLDVAVSGINRVERESISSTHPARFLLIGTMNPEEGDLRPQLLDRFGLTVEVAGAQEIATRTEVVRRRIAFEKDPADFTQSYTEADHALAQQIDAAKAGLDRVLMPATMLDLISHICIGSQVDGLRADITMHKTATTLAAWDGRFDVTTNDVRQAARFVLPHRRRRQPFEDPGLDEQELDDLIDQYSPHPNTESGPNRDTRQPDDGGDGSGNMGDDSGSTEDE